MNLIPPPVGTTRYYSFDLTARILSQMPPGRFIVEIGSTRADESWEGDGFSTPFFAYHAIRHGHFFYSVDALQKVTEEATRICAKYGILPSKQVNFVTMDGIWFLKRWAEVGVWVDFLYLDAWDHIEPHKELSEQLHLEALQAIEHRFAPGAYVLIDDIHDTQTWEGKGKRVIPYLIEKGWKFQYVGYQVLMQKEERDDAQVHAAAASG